MFITTIKYILECTTPFTAICFVLLLAAIIFVAIKCPAKLHSIGTVTIVFGLLCFFVSFISVYDCIQVHFSDCSYRNLVTDKMFSGETISIEDFKSVESMWQYLVSPLTKSFAILLWSLLNYLLSRILYIIRTPRI